MRPYYEADGVTIYHGDCREIVPALGCRHPERPDLVLTDPPYAIGATRGEWSVTASVAIGLHEAARKVLSKGSMVVFTTTSGRGIEFTQGAVGKHLPFNRLLVWRKVGGRSRAVSPWQWDAVGVLVFGRAPQDRLGESSVLDTPVPMKHEHPSMVPQAVAEWCYAPFDREGITVLDPFMGTGALLLPAHARGRRVIGIEVEERYCELAALALGRTRGREYGGPELPLITESKVLR